ncbi:MAG TPA: hypothetical protein VGW37_08425 [Terriglobia bacterium]|nr:hypothetical protein [Terriglobia bacterium]
MNMLIVLFLVTGMGWASATTVRNDGCLELAGPNVRTAEGIRDATQWQNPYLVVQPKGIELITGIPRRKQVVPLLGFERALRRLPATVWPYGRIAAVQEAGVRSGLKSDDELISQNRVEVEGMLAKLCVKVSHWPS